GWNGGAYGVGSRISLKYSRAIIDAIHNGELAQAEFENYPIFNIEIPKGVSNVPNEVLNPSAAWKGTKESYVATVEKLAGLFNENFQLYADQATPEIIAAGPQL
ncbi:Protein kinase C-like 1, partial [Basidiobolus ranarum]